MKFTECKNLEIVNCNYRKLSEKGKKIEKQNQLASNSNRKISFSTAMKIVALCLIIVALTCAILWCAWTYLLVDIESLVSFDGLPEYAPMLVRAGIIAMIVLIAAGILFTGISLILSAHKRQAKEMSVYTDDILLATTIENRTIGNLKISGGGDPVPYLARYVSFSLDALNPDGKTAVPFKSTESSWKLILLPEVFKTIIDVGNKTIYGPYIGKGVELSATIDNAYVKECLKSKELERELESAKIQYEADKNRQRTQIANLQQDNNSLTQKLKESEKTCEIAIANGESVRQQLEETVASNVQERARRDKEYADIHQRVGRAEAECTAIKQSYDQLSKKHTGLKDNYNKLVIEKRDLQLAAERKEQDSKREAADSNKILKDTQSALNEANSRAEDLSDKYKCLKGELETLRSVYNDTVSSKQEQEQVTNELKIRLEETSATLSLVKEMLDGALNERDTLKREYNQLLTSKDELNKQLLESNQSTSVRIADIHKKNEDERSALNERLQSVTRELKEENTRNDKLSTDYENLSKSHAALEAEHRRITEGLAEKTAENEEQKEQLLHLSKKYESSQEKNKELTQLYDKILQEKNSLAETGDARLAAMTVAMQAIEKDFNDLREDYENITELQKKTNAEAQARTKEIDILTKELAATKDALKNEAERAANAEIRCESIEEKHKATLSAKESLEKQLSAQKTDGEKATATLNKLLEDERAAHTNEIDAYNRRLADTNNELTASRDREESLQEKYERVCDNYEDAQSKIDVLERENAEAKALAEKLTSNAKSDSEKLIIEHQKELENISAKLAAAEKIARENKEAYSALKSDHDTMTKELQEARDINAALDKQIATEREENEHAIMLLNQVSADERLLYEKNVEELNRVAAEERLAYEAKTEELMAQFEAERTEAQAKIKELNAHIEKERADNADTLTANKNELQKSTTLLEQVREQLANEQIQNKKLKEEMKLTITNQRAAEEKYTQETRERDAKINELDKRCASLSGSLKEHKEVKAAYSELQGSHAKLREEHNDLTASNAELRKLVERTAAERDSKAKELEDSQEKRMEESETLIKKIDQLSTQKKELESSIAKKDDVIKRFQHASKVDREHYRNVEEQYELAVNNNRDLQKENAELRTEVRKSKANAEAIEIQKRELASRDEAIELLTRQKGILEQSLNEELVTKDKLAKLEAEKTATIEQLEGERDFAISSLNSLQIEYQRVKSDADKLEDANSTIEEQKKAIASKDEEIATRTKSEKELQAKLTEMEKDARSLQQSNGDLKARNKHLTEENQSLNNSVATLTENSRATQEAHDRVSNEIVALRKKCNSLQEYASSLQFQLEQVQDDNKSLTEECEKAKKEKEIALRNQVNADDHEANFRRIMKERELYIQKAREDARKGSEGKR